MQLPRHATRMPNDGPKVRRDLPASFEPRFGDGVDVVLGIGGTDL